MTSDDDRWGGGQGEEHHMWKVLHIFLFYLILILAFSSCSNMWIKYSTSIRVCRHHLTLVLASSYMLLSTPAEYLFVTKINNFQQYLLSTCSTCGPHLSLQKLTLGEYPRKSLLCVKILKIMLNIGLDSRLTGYQIFNDSRRYHRI